MVTDATHKETLDRVAALEAAVQMWEVAAAKWIGDPTPSKLIAHLMLADQSEMEHQAKALTDSGTIAELKGLVTETEARLRQASTGRLAREPGGMGVFVVTLQSLTGKARLQITEDQKAGYFVVEAFRLTPGLTWARYKEWRGTRKQLKKLPKKLRGLLIVALLRGLRVGPTTAGQPVRGRFNVEGTKTGRTPCDKPNLSKTCPLKPKPFTPEEMNSIRKAFKGLADMASEVGQYSMRPMTVESIREDLRKINDYANEIGADDPYPLLKTATAEELQQAIDEVKKDHKRPSDAVGHNPGQFAVDVEPATGKIRQVKVDLVPADTYFGAMSVTITNPPGGLYADVMLADGAHIAGPIPKDGNQVPDVVASALTAFFFRFGTQYLKVKEEAVIAEPTERKPGDFVRQSAEAVDMLTGATLIQLRKLCETFNFWEVEFHNEEGQCHSKAWIREQIRQTVKARGGSFVGNEIVIPAYVPKPPAAPPVTKRTPDVVRESLQTPAVTISKEAEDYLTGKTEAFCQYINRRFALGVDFSVHTSARQVRDALRKAIRGRPWGFVGSNSVDGLPVEVEPDGFVEPMIGGMSREELVEFCRLEEIEYVTATFDDGASLLTHRERVREAVTPPSQPENEPAPRAEDVLDRWQGEDLRRFCDEAGLDPELLRQPGVTLLEDARAAVRKELQALGAVITATGITLGDGSEIAADHTWNIVGKLPPAVDPHAPGFMQS